MAQAGLSQVRLAAAVGVDPKTVERWVAQGRTPHPRHRVAVSDAPNPPPPCAAPARPPPTPDPLLRSRHPVRQRAEAA